MELREEGLCLKARFDGPVQQVISRVRDAFSAEGFGVLTEIDVRETLKKKLGVDFRHYVILGMCNPAIAHGALSVTSDVGALLPCNVCVYDEDGGVVVSALDPEKALEALDTPELAPFAQEAAARIRRAMASLMTG